jgi:hypothetical protein
VLLSPYLLFSVLVSSLRDYEAQGRRFYALAARTSHDSKQQPALEELAEHFAHARSALNGLSERYLKRNRVRYFEEP